MGISEGERGIGSENVYQESEGSSACLQSEQKELKTLTLQSRDSGEISVRRHSLPRRKEPENKDAFFVLQGIGG